MPAVSLSSNCLHGRAVLRTVLLPAMMLSAAGVAGAQNQVLDLMDRLSVIAGDYTPRNETEGTAFVYGSYLPGNSAQFGFNSGAVADDRENILWLNNGVGNGGRTTLLTGSLLSRTLVNTTQFTLNGNAANDPAIRQGAAVWQEGMASLGVQGADELWNLAGEASRQWARLAPNSSSRLPGNGSLLLEAAPQLIDGNSVAVFHVRAEDIFDGGGGFDRLEAAFNGAGTLLINVSGTSITVNKNFASGLVGSERNVLFNFYEATSLNLGSNFRGAVYAPFAQVVQNNHNIDGTLVAGSVIQTAEIHNERFDGYLPFTAVPEPSSGMMGMAAGGVLMLRRRRE